jgi:hypothetical protein
VISAEPQEVIQSALDGIVPPERIFGARFAYDEATGEIRSIVRVPAGYGKVAVLDELQTRLGITRDRIVYVGRRITSPLGQLLGLGANRQPIGPHAVPLLDGSSDVHVMLHVNRRDGFTIAVSETRYITQIAQRTVLSDDAASVLVPILEDVIGWAPARIRDFFEAQGFVLQEWDRMRTDWLTIRSQAEELAER